MFEIVRNMLFKWSVVGIFITSGLSACAADDGDQTYHGVFVSSFETSAYEPCNSNERWWLIAVGDVNEAFWSKAATLRAEYENLDHLELENSDLPAYYLEASGVVSERGNHGHMGAYDRQFNLDSFSNFRLATPTEQQQCLTAGILR